MRHLTALKRSVKKFSSNKVLSLLFLLVVVAAIPLTVYIAQQNQDLRQHASGGTFECSKEEADNGSKTQNCDAGNSCTGKQYSEYDSCEDKNNTGACDTFYCHWSDCKEPISCPEPKNSPPSNSGNQGAKPPGSNTKPPNSSSNNPGQGSSGSNDCRDNPVSPPNGYSWKADCSNACGANSDCPANTSDPSNINPKTSNWCYGFSNGSYCMQLRSKTSSGTLGPGTSPKNPTSPGGVGGGTSKKVTPPSGSCTEGDYNRSCTGKIGAAAGCNTDAGESQIYHCESGKWVQQNNECRTECVGGAQGQFVEGQAPGTSPPAAPAVQPNTNPGGGYCFGNEWCDATNSCSQDSRCGASTQRCLYTDAKTGSSACYLGECKDPNNCGFNKGCTPNPANLGVATYCPGQAPTNFATDDPAKLFNFCRQAIEYKSNQKVCDANSDGKYDESDLKVLQAKIPSPPPASKNSSSSTGNGGGARTSSSGGNTRSTGNSNGTGSTSNGNTNGGTGQGVCNPDGSDDHTDPAGVDANGNKCYIDYACNSDGMGWHQDPRRCDTAGNNGGSTGGNGTNSGQVCKPGEQKTDPAGKDINSNQCWKDSICNASGTGWNEPGPIRCDHVSTGGTCYYADGTCPDGSSKICSGTQIINGCVHGVLNNCSCPSSDGQACIGVPGDDTAKVLLCPLDTFNNNVHVYCSGRWAGGTCSGGNCTCK